MTLEEEVAKERALLDAQEKKTRKARAVFEKHANSAATVLVDARNQRNEAMGALVFDAGSGA